VKAPADANGMMSLLAANDVEGCIKVIAKSLGLPIQIDLSYVPSGYRADGRDGFTSTALVETAWGTRGGQAITAQVSLPECLPLYGTPGLDNYPIKVRVSRDCADKPTTFIAVMAHELSHVVLHSLWHREKDNEVYTDLTAMMLGFAPIMRDGRRVVKTTGEGTQTVIYGYLSDEQFAFAYGKIETVLSKYRKRTSEFLDKTAALESLLTDGKKTVVRFGKYLEYVDRKLQEKMPAEDTYRICVCHQPGYTSAIERATRDAEKELQRLHTFIQAFGCYNNAMVDAIRQHENQLRAVMSELSSAHEALLADVAILRKHVSPLYRLRVEGRTGLR